MAEQMGRQVVVTVERGLPPAIGDRALLKRALINLVMNALRHSGSKEVRVEAMHNAAAARLALQVIDHGRGMAWEDQGRVFERFASIRRGDQREPSGDQQLTCFQDAAGPSYQRSPRAGVKVTNWRNSLSASHT